MTTRPARIPFAEIAALVQAWPRVAGYGPAIAQKYGVPIGTARRWIYETRRQGLLPSGRQVRPCRYCDGTGLTKYGSRRDGVTR